MMRVATGGGSVEEHFPFVLRVPTLLRPGGEQLLGLGDIAIPGLLVVFVRLFDVARCRTWYRGLFPPTLAAYGVGLGLTYLALLVNLGGQGGQPALLFLAPCTLGTAVATAAVMGELKAAWKGDMGGGRGQGRGDMETGVDT